MRFYYRDRCIENVDQSYRWNLYTLEDGEPVDEGSAFLRDALRFLNGSDDVEVVGSSPFALGTLKMEAQNRRRFPWPAAVILTQDPPPGNILQLTDWPRMIDHPRRAFWITNV